MAHPLKLPALGALAVAAAAFGLHLGESAVADINPIHFQGAAVHPRDRGAALADVPAAPIQSEFALAYGWDQAANARAQDCPGCGQGGSADHYSAPQTGYVSEVDRALAPPQPRPRQAPAQPLEQAQEDAFAGQYAAVDRYAHYEIEVAAAEPAADEEPAYAEYEE